MEQKSPSINYLYFGLFFAFLCLISTSSIFLKDNLAGSRLFFWFYAIGQIALEVTILSFLAHLLFQFANRIIFWLFIGATFCMLLLHFFDFMMDRVLDLSLWNAFSIFILDESLANLYFLLDASGVPLWAWCALALFLLLFPFLGMLIYKASAWLALKKPLALKNEVFLQLFFCIPAALFIWDHSASKIIDPDAYTEFIKSLPWKRTFLKPQTIELSIQTPLRAPKKESDIISYLQTITPQTSKKPNIYLFIAESLRNDFLTIESAPNLVRFRDENIQATTSLSSANGTHLSWFSIFHSEFPLYWQTAQANHWNLGSPALALFKKLGYQIRVYSSAELHYYGMKDLLFGKNNYLTDSLELFNHSPPKEAYLADHAALSAMRKDLEDPTLQEGQFIIVFWDGTHFDYSWPKEKPAKFIPFANEFAYFKTFHSQANIELIRNRYKNAVHYIDSLFGEFLTFAPKDSLIVFTGDHGEEFFDHGHLFHCSHLVAAQTTVPIYMKLGGKKMHLPMLNHIDIMPSLLDESFHSQVPFLEGESVLRGKKSPFGLMARFNASQTPYEFCLHNGTHKLTLQFENKKNIFDTTKLNILRLSSADDQGVQNKGKIQEWVYTEFGPLLDRLFPKK